MPAEIVIIQQGEISEQVLVALGEEETVWCRGGNSIVVSCGPRGSVKADVLDRSAAPLGAINFKEGQRAFFDDFGFLLPASDTQATILISRV